MRIGTKFAGLTSYATTDELCASKIAWWKNPFNMKLSGEAVLNMKRGGKGFDDTSEMPARYQASRRGKNGLEESNDDS